MKSLDNVRLWFNMLLIVTSNSPCETQIMNLTTSFLQNEKSIDFDSVYSGAIKHTTEVSGHDGMYQSAPAYTTQVPGHDDLNASPRTYTTRVPGHDDLNGSPRTYTTRVPGHDDLNASARTYTTRVPGHDDLNASARTYTTRVPGHDNLNASARTYTTRVPGPDDLNVKSHEHTTRVPGYADLDKTIFLGIPLLDYHPCYECVGRCMVTRKIGDGINGDNANPGSWKDEGHILVENRTTSSSSTECRWACRCDIRCTIYGDCCYDFYKVCLKLNDNETTDLFEGLFQGYDAQVVNGNIYDSPGLCKRIPKHVSPFQPALSVRACLSSIRTLESVKYYVISRCPTTWLDTDVRSACENNSESYVHNIPVNDPTPTGLVFKNLYCALCHARHVNQSYFWNANIKCPKHFLRNVSDMTTTRVNIASLASSMCVLDLMPRDDDFLRINTYLNINYANHVLNETFEVDLMLSKWACYFYILPVLYRQSPIDMYYANGHCALYNRVPAYEPVHKHPGNYNRTTEVASTSQPTHATVGYSTAADCIYTMPMQLLFSFQDSNLHNLHIIYNDINVDIVDNYKDVNMTCAGGEVYSLSSGSCEKLPCLSPRYHMVNGICVDVAGNVTEDDEKDEQALTLFIQFDAVLLGNFSHASTCTVPLSQTDKINLLTSSLCQNHNEMYISHSNQDIYSGGHSKNRGVEISAEAVDILRSRYESSSIASQPTLLPDVCLKTVSLFNESISSNVLSNVNVSQIINVLSKWTGENVSMVPKLSIDTTAHRTFPDSYLRNTHISGSLLHVNNSAGQIHDICMFSVHVHLAMTIPTDSNLTIAQFISELVNYHMAGNIVKIINYMERESVLAIGDISIEAGMTCNASDSRTQIQRETIGGNDVTVSYIQTLLQSQGFAFNITESPTNDLEIIFCRRVHLSLWERQFGKCPNRLITTNVYTFDETYAYFNYRNDSYKTTAFLVVNRTLTFCSANVTNTEKVATIFMIPNIYVTRIGLSLSLLCLVFTLITYSMFPSLRNVPGLLVMCLSVTLAMAMLLFLVGVTQTDIPWVCVTIASVLHFLWFCVFLWMNALSFDLCRTFSSIRIPSNQSRSKLIYKYAAFAICLSLIAVACALITGFINKSTEGYLHSVYGHARFCWIGSARLNLYWFGIPTAISQAFNLCFFVKSVYSICMTKNQTSMVNNDRGKILDVLLYFKLSLIMGVTWLLFYLSSFDSSNILFSISTVVNSLNGVFLFIVFVCKKRVFRLFRRKFAAYKIAKSRASSSTGV